MSTSENQLEDQALNNQDTIENESTDQLQNSETEQDTEEATPLSEEEQLKISLATEQDKFLRLFAEFENYKKRTSKERMDLFKTANQEVIVAMLPVVDDFERALKELSKDESSELFKGVSLIQNKFWGVLKNKGLEEVAVKAGDVFDSELHDAITQIPAADKKMKGKVIDVIEKGFQLGDKIIRHPKVVVGN